MLCRFAIFLLLAPLGAASAQDFAGGVLRVRAVAADGAIKLGSGVLVAPGQVATACHVTRGAAVIELLWEGQRWAVADQIGSARHDLCLLRSPDIDLEPVTVRPSDELEPGEPVVASGFEGGDHARVMHGTVVALYKFDGGNVIRTDAKFDFGSSGGALFDRSGKLVGILAFKARAGEQLRFAVPTEWIAPGSAVYSRFRTVGRDTAENAFWEQAHGERPAFLGVALRDASIKQE
jgi:S1-C subfamily serine protease